MDSKEFKNFFGEIAKANGFEKSFGAWFIESSESIIVLNLQKSNFGNYYELNIKIYVQGIFGNSYTKNKELVKDTGDIFRRHPPEYKDVFNLDDPMVDDKRKQRLEELFGEFIKPFTATALSRIGLKELETQDKILLLPAVKEELEKLK